MNKNNRIVRFGLLSLVTVGGLLGLVALLPTLGAVWEIGNGIFNTAVQKCYPAYGIPCMVSATTNALTTLAGFLAYFWLIYTGLKVIETMPPASVIYFRLLEQTFTFGSLALVGFTVAVVASLTNRLCFRRK